MSISPPRFRVCAALFHIFYTPIHLIYNIASNDRYTSRAYYPIRHITSSLANTNTPGHDTTACLRGPNLHLIKQHIITRSLHIGHPTRKQHSTGMVSAYPAGRPSRPRPPKPPQPRDGDSRYAFIALSHVATPSQSSTPEPDLLPCRISVMASKGDDPHPRDDGKNRWPRAYARGGDGDPKDPHPRDPGSRRGRMYCDPQPRDPGQWILFCSCELSLPPRAAWY